MGIQDDEMWSHIYVREERAMEADEQGRARECAAASDGAVVLRPPITACTRSQPSRRDVLRARAIVSGFAAMAWHLVSNGIEGHPSRADVSPSPNPDARPPVSSQ